MNPLQKCKDHSSLQFYRHRSNRFGGNGLTDACRAVFSKHAAPKSHAFFSCHGPLPPDTRCGELRGGPSSRPPGAESLKHRNQPRQSRPPPKEVNSQYGISAEEASRPRHDVRSVAMGIDEAQRNLRSGFPYCSYKERQPAGSIGLCGGSYCRRLSSPRLGQDIRQSTTAGEPYHPRAGSFHLRGMLMAADGRATVDCKSAATSNWRAGLRT